MTPSTYLQMLENLRRLCHYAVIKWNLSSKCLDIKRKRALNLILSRFCRSTLSFSPENLDLDRLRQPYQGAEWHCLYYMHGDSWRLRRGDDELKPRICVWYRLAVVVYCTSTIQLLSDQSEETWKPRRDCNAECFSRGKSWTLKSHGASAWCDWA